MAVPLKARKTEQEADRYKSGQFWMQRKTIGGLFLRFGPDDVVGAVEGHEHQASIL